MASVGPAQRDSFEQFGELVSELLKLAALLVFGALIAGTVVLSILLHSSTDVVVAHWFDDEWEVPRWSGRIRSGR